MSKDGLKFDKCAFKIEFTIENSLRDVYKHISTKDTNRWTYIDAEINEEHRKHTDIHRFSYRSYKRYKFLYFS